MAGHVFVLQGDLSRLSCDAVVLPCDSRGNVSAWCKPLLGGLETEPTHEGWLHVPAAGLQDGVGLLPAPEDSGSLTVLVATADWGRDPLELAELTRRLVRALQVVSQRVHVQSGRSVPLVAVPLIGTGEGGLAGKRGSVVHAVMAVLHERVSALSFDVALVLSDRQDYAAVQAARAEVKDSVTPHDTWWPELTHEQIEAADALGVKAAKGDLSIFVGAGASKPAGLPDWTTLLQAMAERAGRTVALDDLHDYLFVAQRLKEELGPRYATFMREQFDVSHHAIGHALLAGLHVKQMVTTNYDPCLELALEAIHGPGSFNVLTRSHATGGKPWLLKLHGDIAKPDTLILGRDEYAALKAEAGALHGVVESLLLTSHLLFVGFGFTDHDFSELADGVRAVRAHAEHGDGAARPAATALTLSRGLSPDPDRWSGEIQTVTAGKDNDTRAAARVLEILLDRLAWSALQSGELAAEYLLDERYAEDANDADFALRGALLNFVDTLPAEARRSVAWPKVARLLSGLGSSPHGESPAVGAAESLALEVARCPLIPIALGNAAHPCHDVVSVQSAAEAQRQVPEAWAGGISTAKVLFLSSNPSISEPFPGESPESAEAYPVVSHTDAQIIDFITRRFDPTVTPRPYVLDDHHLQRDGQYRKSTTKFWSSIRKRAEELLGPGAEPHRDYAMTEIVHCKSKAEIGVKKAAATCGERYLDRIVHLSPAGVVVVVGSAAHGHLAEPWQLPAPPYAVWRAVGEKDRLVVHLPHPNAFAPKTFKGIYPEFLDEIRRAAGGGSRRAD